MFRAIFCPSSGQQDFVLQLVVKCTQVVAGRWDGTRRHSVFGMKDIAGSNILHTEHIVRASAFQATGRKPLRCILRQAVKPSLALLRMGKKFPETF